MASREKIREIAETKNAQIADINQVTAVAVVVWGKILVDPGDPLGGIGKKLFRVTNQNRDGLTDLCIDPQQPRADRGHLLDARLNRLARGDSINQGL